ncbi:nucleotidyltransferase domain-containing protein [Phycisphaerales bacterium AB-hyl4]|uniref:Nucleotidyltransferase domain-containing protein n=1 Tax=Natronomicrosphaera hydrolytica TaxID=3242702 RepID=A0ABV4U8U5_9BACT
MAKPIQQRDIHAWQPLSVPEVVAVMRGATVPWWIAGGWAIDLYLGRQTRPHGDTDVLVLRRDQLAIQQHLCRWHLYKTGQPTPSRLAPWPEGEFLKRETGINDIWIKNEVGRPWRLQLMFMESEGERWVFRRDERIGGRIDELGWQTSEGVPVLRPEIQLLYKGRLADRRPKDDADFAAVLPHLATSQWTWLAKGLKQQFGDTHPWLERLSKQTSGPSEPD